MLLDRKLQGHDQWKSQQHDQWKSQQHEQEKSQQHEQEKSQGHEQEKSQQYEQEKFNILMLCTSARSIMAEALFNEEGSSYFRTFSAGSQPTGKVNPFGLEKISKLGINNDFCSKRWDEFSGSSVPFVPPLDFVITHCGNAAQGFTPVSLASLLVSMGLPPSRNGDEPGGLCGLF